MNRKFSCKIKYNDLILKLNETLLKIRMITKINKSKEENAKKKSFDIDEENKKVENKVKSKVESIFFK